MKTIVFAVLALCVALPAVAQAPKPGSDAAKAQRARAIQRCQDNHGTDCSSEQGLREWLIEERPQTPEEQRQANINGTRRARCAQNPKGASC